MHDNDIALYAKDFSMDWHERGYEKGETQKFWLSLLNKIFRVNEPDKIINFEVPVPNGYIDAYIPATKVLIEQKSFDVPLDNEVFAQAKRYADALPDDKRPRWIITCNFQEFKIYKPNRPEPTVIKLRDLRYNFQRLNFLIDFAADDAPPDEKISKDALHIISQIYDAFANNYKKNKVANYEDDLNKICTRLVFCLYAGDAHIFDANQFFNYLQSFNDDQRNAALQNLFHVLNTPENQRDNLPDDLKSFPYVNGGLFDENISFPTFNKTVGNPTASIGAFNARKKFSWHEISPPIFGAMFESTFSRDNRQRASGMFYTSVENIHKVIDPLFLDDLRAEFDAIKRKRKDKVRELNNFQDKIAALKFLDPACGSGNFLTETYLSLRRLENEILEELSALVELPDNPVKVSIQNFYGIEINGFAVAVAQTALWIAENQMLQATEGAIGKNLQALPLKNYATIIKANALQVDWKKFAPNVDFIIGNPPFVGARLMNAAQKADIQKVFAGGWKNSGNLDYVACWYKKSADFMKNNNVRAALVATNSICQGDSVGTLWKNLFAGGIHIDFCHRTFKWLSDSDNMAHVHCVVVGFSSAPNPKPKFIFDGDKIFKANNINAYLVDGDNIFVESRNQHLQDDVPKINKGNQPTDGGNLIIEADALEDFIKQESAAKKYVKRLIGAEEFIKGKKRYCLWLVGVPMDEIKKMPLVAERVENCRQYRLKGANDRKKLAAASNIL